VGFKNMNKQKVSGYVMAVVGFVMLAINATSYIFGLDFRHPALTVMGLVFVTIGGGMIRKTDK